MNKLKNLPLFKDIPHIVYILIAFLASLAVWALTRESGFIPVIITLAGTLGGLSQKVYKDTPAVNAQTVENQEIKVNQSE